MTADGPVTLTETGRAGHQTIRSSLEEITAQLFDFPVEDIATARRVLAIITAPANAGAGRTTHAHRTSLITTTPTTSPAPASDDRAGGATHDAAAAPIRPICAAGAGFDEIREPAPNGGSGAA